jgi:hypothetical protein
MSKAGVTGVTVSVEFGDTTYGAGSKSFTNLQAKFSEPTEELDDVVDQGLDLYFSAWKTLLAGRWATGVIDTETFKAQLAATTEKIEKARKFLRRKANEQQQ